MYLCGLNKLIDSRKKNTHSTNILKDFCLFKLHNRIYCKIIFKLIECRAMFCSCHIVQLSVSADF